MLKKILLGLLGVILLLGIGGYLYYRFVLYVPPLISDQDRDVDDMYRRLAHFSARLEELGLSHVSHGEELLREIGGKVYPLTENLSTISALALSSVHSGENEYPDQEIAETLNYLEAGENGLVVAVVPGLRSILD